MTSFPSISTENLKGSSLDLPTGKDAILLLSFDKLHYPTIIEWMGELNGKTVYNMPIVSDRFLLMKQALVDGLESFFVDHLDQTYPTFVNRVSFFESIGIEQDNQPVIVHLKSDGSFTVSDCP